MDPPDATPGGLALKYTCVCATIQHHARLLLACSGAALLLHDAASKSEKSDLKAYTLLEVKASARQRVDEGIFCHAAWRGGINLQTPS